SGAGCAPAGGRSAPAACRPAPEPAVLTPGDARRAILAGAPDGTAAVAAWESATGGPLRAAVRTADGWTRAIGVSERGASSPAAAAPPGGTVVAWDGWDGDRRAVRV